MKRKDASGDTRTGPQIAGAGSETPLSLDPLYGRRRDGRDKSGGAEKKRESDASHR
jgi:hypothetical protein